MSCNMDCLRCTKPDCDFDGITPEERKAQDEYDSEVRLGRKYGKGIAVWRYNHTEKGKAAAGRYERSDKGRERQKRYEQTEKGRQRQKRYEQSELGKASNKRKQQKRIDSGKNAEYCRRYYQKKKAEREAAANGQHIAEKQGVLSV